jgi:hypothetical protein
VFHPDGGMANKRLGTLAGSSTTGLYAPSMGYSTAAADILKFIFVYVSFWVIPRLLNFISRRFGTFYLFHLHRQEGEYFLPSCL